MRTLVESNRSKALVPVGEYEILQANWPEQRLQNLAKLWVIWRSMRTDLSKLTQKDYNMTGRIFCDWMEGKDFSPKTMMEWMRNLQKYRTIYGRPMIPERVNRLNRAVTQFVKWLIAAGQLKHDPTGVIPRLHEPPPKPARLWTHDEYEKIKGYMAAHTRCGAYLWLWVLGYRTGMSMVDCSHLRWPDVHLNDNGPSFIERRRQKMMRFGDRALCTIPLIPGTDVYEMLLLLKSTRHMNTKVYDGISDYVHQDCPAIYCQTRVRYSVEFKHFIQRALKNPYESRTFRNLRQTFCSNLMNSGAEAALVCRMTGHSDINMLVRYLKPDLSKLGEQLVTAFNYAEQKSALLIKAPPEKTAEATIEEAVNAS